MSELDKRLSASPKYMIGLLQAMGVSSYIALFVSMTMWLSPTLSRSIPSFLGPIIFLLVFVISALVCGSLMLAYPLWLAIQRRIVDATVIVVWSIGWLLAILFAIIILAVIF